MTIHYLQDNVWWPGLQNDVSAYCDSCFDSALGVFDMIMLVIDHLTNMVHLIPTKQTYKAKDVAEVLFENIYK